jgi:hypothetical protein
VAHSPVLVLALAIDRCQLHVLLLLLRRRRQLEVGPVIPCRRQGWCKLRLLLLFRCRKRIFEIVKACTKHVPTWGSQPHP